MKPTRLYIEPEAREALGMLSGETVHVLAYMHPRPQPRAVRAGAVFRGTASPGTASDLATPDSL